MSQQVNERPKDKEPGQSRSQLEWPILTEKKRERLPDGRYIIYYEFECPDRKRR